MLAALLCFPHVNTYLVHSISISYKYFPSITGNEDPLITSYGNSELLGY